LPSAVNDVDCHRRIGFGSNGWRLRLVRYGLEFVQRRLRIIERGLVYQ
jgi:hypothetical protein